MTLSMVSVMYPMAPVISSKYSFSSGSSVSLIFNMSTPMVSEFNGVRTS